MNCREFEIHLEALLDGKVEPSKQGACLEHAADCRLCGELWMAVGGASRHDDEVPAPSLVEGVLERTIGSACAQARDLLPALVDRDLSDTDRQLIELHLSSCASCLRLATTLSMLKRELPGLAEVPLDARFTREVLAATLAPWARLQRWWLSRWSAWVHRPRFAMEAAYVGLLVIMLVLGAFSTPLAALPQKGLDLVQTDHDTPSIWTEANDDLGTFWEWVASLFERNEETSTEDTP
jgi:predicted anti-sigma-YlaC factor YlaD